MRLSLTPRTCLAGSLVATALLVAMFASGYWLTAFTLAACYAIAASGLGLVYAGLGQVSLVQAALIAVGGWIALRLGHLGASFEIAALCGTIGTGIIGFLIGLPALRMRGLYLALVTLMAAGAGHILFNRVRFPNGGDGFWGAVRSGGASMERPALASSDPAWFLCVVLTCIIAFQIVEWHRHGRPGRAWALIRRSEAAAMAAGVNVVLYKSWAFTLAGALGGLSGAMLAGTLGMLDPVNFRALDSIMLFALSVVGGVFSWTGAVIAGVLYKVVPSLLNVWGIDGDVAGIVFGAALLHALITAPRGLAGVVEHWLAPAIGNESE